jgi:hypothetical protein
MKFGVVSSSAEIKCTVHLMVQVPLPYNPKLCKRKILSLEPCTYTFGKETHTKSSCAQTHEQERKYNHIDIK